MDGVPPTKPEEHPDWSYHGQPSGAVPGVVFITPDPAWSAFPPASIKLLLTLIEQALRAGARELQVVTVRGHHASVMLVMDRTPMEIAHIGLAPYDGVARFVRKGLFNGVEVQTIRSLGSTWEMRMEFTQTPSGEGFGLTFKPFLYGVG